MEASSNLIKDTLETFLKREGLYEFIPNYRKSQIFPTLWLGGLWLSASYFYSFLGKKSLFSSLLTPLILFIVFFLLVAIYYTVRSFRFKKDLTSDDAASLGGIFIFGAPLIVILHLGLVSRSWMVPIYYLAIYIGIVILSMLLNKQGEVDKTL